MSKKSRTRPDPYQIYDKSYKSKSDKHNMYGKMYSYDEWQFQYTALKNFRAEMGYDTKNVNRILVSDQEYKISQRQAKAQAVALKELRGLDKVPQAIKIRSEKLVMTQAEYDIIKGKYKDFMATGMQGKAAGKLISQMYFGS